MSLRVLIKMMIGVTLALPFVGEFHVLADLVWGLGALGVLYLDLVVGLLLAASAKMVWGRPTSRSWVDLAISLFITLALVVINLLWLHDVPSHET